MEYCQYYCNICQFLIHYFLLFQKQLLWTFFSPKKKIYILNNNTGAIDQNYPKIENLIFGKLIRKRAEKYTIC